MIRGFFFDLDGTLVDTHRANFEAYRQAVKDVSGIEITLDDFGRSIGYAAKTFLPWFAPGLSDGAYRKIHDLKTDYYKNLTHLTTLNKRLIGLIEEVKSDAQLVLVTTARRQNAQAILEHHNLRDMFDCIITQEDVLQQKPAPDAYNLALQKTGLPPSEVLAFEDSLSGQKAAEAAGIAVVAINTFAI
jgi:beta-phosphoglucomutase